ncbi:hypothetical protein PMIN01_10344 [Paraphaeosphaeria minitans]|uniref:Uncharacterized protein n=1 Tax=Paraphaeosphaeria minitans TaxID=565426 RepID=A0A9P6G8Z8_9PLEO|nr:hypothetical protein PMIN01_10344 [Paraphaeosphaeria minitans]
MRSTGRAAKPPLPAPAASTGHPAAVGARLMITFDRTGVQDRRALRQPYEDAGLSRQERNEQWQSAQADRGRTLDVARPTLANQKQRQQHMEGAWQARDITTWHTDREEEGSDCGATPTPVVRFHLGRSSRLTARTQASWRPGTQQTLFLYQPLLLDLTRREKNGSTAFYCERPDIGADDQTCCVVWDLLAAESPNAL